MQRSSPPLHRRSFLIQLTGWTTAAAGCALLGGCGGGGSDTASAASMPVVVATAAPSAVGAVPTTDTQRLNFALNLHYLSAQFHTFASTGSGLPSTVLTGTGQQGSTTGARTATLADPLVAATASDFAGDKQAQVIALRQQLGSAAAAMPAIDFSTGDTGAFARAARAIGGSSSLDPFADDTQYLLGAFLIDYALAASQRTLLAQTVNADAATVLGDALTGSIHHTGLMRTLLDIRSAADPTVGTKIAAICAAFATFDGSTGSDVMLTNADTGSSDLVDAAGHPLPFSREPGQVLRLTFLNKSGTTGGFLPLGMNGVGDVTPVSSSS